MLGDLLGTSKDKSAQSTGTGTIAQLADIASSPSVTGLLGSLTSSLGVSEDQAQGGVASLMNYAKSNMSSTEFSSLTEQLPGTEGILSALPQLSSNLGGGSGGLGGLMNKAAEYGEQLGGAALLAQQFESLGLDPNMVMGFVKQISAYLSTPEGQQAKALLMDSFSKLDF
jgi:hypothetical protein